MNIKNWKRGLSLKIEKKNCNNCNKESDVMYRVQYDKIKVWTFICKICLEKLKPNNPNYRYGGTWKK